MRSLHTFARGRQAGIDISSGTKVYFMFGGRRIGIISSRDPPWGIIIAKCGSGRCATNWHWFAVVLSSTVRVQTLGVPRRASHHGADMKAPSEHWQVPRQ